MSVPTNLFAVLHPTYRVHLSWRLPSGAVTWSSVRVVITPTSPAGPALPAITLDANATSTITAALQPGTQYSITVATVTAGDPPTVATSSPVTVNADVTFSVHSIIRQRALDLLTPPPTINGRTVQVCRDDYARPALLLRQDAIQLPAVEVGVCMLRRSSGPSTTRRTATYELSLTIAVSASDKGDAYDDLTLLAQLVRDRLDLPAGMGLHLGLGDNGQTWREDDPVFDRDSRMILLETHCLMDIHNITRASRPLT